MQTTRFATHRSSTTSGSGTFLDVGLVGVVGWIWLIVTERSPARSYRSDEGKSRRLARGRLRRIHRRLRRRDVHVRHARVRPGGSHSSGWFWRSLPRSSGSIRSPTPTCGRATPCRNKRGLGLERPDTRASMFRHTGCSGHSASVAQVQDADAYVTTGTGRPDGPSRLGGPNPSIRGRGSPLCLRRKRVSFIAATVRRSGVTGEWEWGRLRGRLRFADAVGGNNERYCDRGRRLAPS